MSNSLIVNVDVGDLDAAIDFYRTGLGLEFVRLLFGGAVAEMTAGSAKVYLIRQDAGTRAVPGSDILRDYAAHWTPVHLDILVEDVESAVAAAVAAGASLSGAIAHYDWGALAPLRDPFGHGVCLLQFKGDGYDSVAG